MQKIIIVGILATAFTIVTFPLLAQNLDEKCSSQEAMNSWTEDCSEWKQHRDAELDEKKRANEEARATYWKAQTEQQDKMTQEAELRENEAIKKDKSEGYKSMTFEDFTLDAKKMKGAKVAIRGYYIDRDERLIRDPISAARWVSNSDVPKNVSIPLLTGNASRDARSTFLRCSDISNPLGCEIVIKGRVDNLTLRNRLGVHWKELGIVVDSIRY